MNGWVVPPSKPYRHPCVVLCNPSDDRPCGRPAGDHTILEWSLCDDCWDAIRL